MGGLFAIPRHDRSRIKRSLDRAFVKVERAPGSHNVRHNYRLQLRPHVWRQPTRNRVAGSQSEVWLIVSQRPLPFVPIVARSRMEASGAAPRRELSN
jgi:hypothetical protein